MIIKKSPQQVQKMLHTGQALAGIVKAVEEHVGPGVTTSELNEIAHEGMKKAGGTPSFLGYHGFPAAICTSLNEVIVHGIPNGRALESGEILSLDFGLVIDGWHADMARTYAIGEVPEKATALIETTKKAFEAGVQACWPGNRLGEIGAAIQGVVEGAGFSVIREYAGHSIGREMHEEGIQVPNYGEPDHGPILEAGMVFAIEPMTSLGSWKTKVLEDGWAVVTADGSLACHYENTVAITPAGPHVLTALH